MNVALWIVAGVLATFPGSGWIEDFSPGALKAIAVLEVLGAVGLTWSISPWPSSWMPSAPSAAHSPTGSSLPPGPPRATSSDILLTTLRRVAI